MGEECHKQCIFEEVLLHRNLAPVDIHGVGKGMKSVKRNANRQDHVKAGSNQLKSCSAHYPVQIINKKVKILEKKQNGQIGCHTYKYPQILAPVQFLAPNKKTTTIGDEDG